MDLGIRIKLYVNQINYQESNKYVHFRSSIACTPRKQESAGVEPS